MALVVEDGTGLPDADSYVSVASADAYHVAHGNAGWAVDTVTEDMREVALRNATAHIDSNPNYQFQGVPVSADQALLWPRTGFGWPQKRVIDATCELALRALAGKLIIDVAADGRIKSEKIGPLEMVYSDPLNGGQVQYAFVDNILAPLLVKKGGWGVTQLVRA
jgi:hypothetical protein